MTATPTEDLVPPSIRITTVLYQNDPVAVERLVHSLARSAEVVRGLGGRGPVSYWVGDSSPSPCLSEALADKLRAAWSTAVGGDFQYEFFDDNLGHAEGNNRLMRSATEQFILLINPDVYASPWLIRELLSPFARPRVAMVEARQLPCEHPKDYDQISGQTGWASLACAMVRTSVAAAVGALDAANFFLYCDDVDYSWRIRLAGHHLCYRPSAVVFHDKRLAGDGTVIASSTEEYYAAEAALLLAHKYSRPDLVADLLDRFDNGPTHHGRAARSYRERAIANTLPTPLDPDHRVAEFVDGNYTRHRF